MRSAAAAAATAALTGVWCLASPGASAAQGAFTVPSPAAITAEQIVDRSVEVRGGLQAWQKITTIIWAGHLESERSPVSSLPFELK